MNIARFEVREWIDPWRDRRPMTDDRVLVQYWKFGTWFIRVSNYRPEVDDWEVDNVIAWMPLPEPYNPVEEEDDD